MTHTGFRGPAWSNRRRRQERTTESMPSFIVFSQSIPLVFNNCTDGSRSRISRRPPSPASPLPAERTPAASTAEELHKICHVVEALERDPHRFPRPRLVKPSEKAGENDRVHAIFYRFLAVDSARLQQLHRRLP